MAGLFDDFILASAVLPDLSPAWRGPKTTCTCGHSWLFHWLKDPHRCNDCKECTGFKAARAEPPAIL